jgi:hypothetical protein
MENRQVRGGRRQANSIVGRRPHRIIASLEPFESRERKPAIWLQQVRSVLRSPRGKAFFPRSVLREYQKDWE